MRPEQPPKSPLCHPVHHATEVLARSLSYPRPTPFFATGTIRTKFECQATIVIRDRPVDSRSVHDPGGKSALDLMRCSEWGQLSNSHGLDARTNKAPAFANPYVFRHLFGKLKRLALWDIRGTGNDDFEFTI